MSGENLVEKVARVFSIGSFGNTWGKCSTAGKGRTELVWGWEKNGLGKIGAKHLRHVILNFNRPGARRGFREGFLV